MKKNITLTTLFFCLLNYHSYAQEDLIIASNTIVNAVTERNAALKDSVSLLEKNDSISTFKGRTIYGIASFYSKNLEGTKTSTGEHFHHKLMTAASNCFPLNTWVRVTNLRNDRSVVVRINDHMADRMYKKGRVVDSVSFCCLAA